MLVKARFITVVALLFAACSASSNDPDAAGNDLLTDLPGESVTGDSKWLPDVVEVLADDTSSLDLPPQDPRVELVVGNLVSPTLGLPGDVGALELVEGRLPAGVFLTAEGLAWGRPTRPEDQVVTLSVTYDDQSSATETWTVSARTGDFAILPLTDVVGETGTALSIQPTTVDGPQVQEVTWTIARGELPAGLVLDAATGLISGSPETAGLYPLLLAAKAGEETAHLATMLRIGPSPLLAAMAEEFEANAMDRMIPNGMLISSWPDGHFGDHGDSGMWTGTYLAAMALKYALTGDDSGMVHVEEGLTTCRMVTGVPGLTARGIEKDEWMGHTDGPNISVEHPEGHQSTTPGYEDYLWVGDVSRDQWTGHFMGHALTWLLAGGETREKASANMVAMALHLHDNDMEIHDVDGEVTKYGHVSGYAMDGGFPMPNGVNAIMSLAWFQSALVAADDDEAQAVLGGVVDQMLSPPPEGWNFLEDDGEWGYIEAMEDILYPYLGGHSERKWFNMNITNDAFFNALLVLPDGPERDRIVNLWWDEMWVDHGETPLTRRAQSEKNAWFTFMFLGATGRYDADAHFEALEQMVRFPPPPRLAVAIQNSDNPDYPHDPEFDGWAFEALPTEERCSGTNFLWQRNPYELDCMGSVGQEYAGTDFLAPYWLGVAMGYIDERL